MPPTAKTTGSTYSSIFCCCAYGPLIALSGMFLRISWRWVVKVVAVITATSDSVTTWTQTLPSAPRNVSEILTPSSSACSRSIASCVVRTPSPRWSLVASLMTRNSAKKIGAWARIGRQEAKGLVPASL